MNKSIIKFLEKQNCASICTVDTDGRPYCFSCFYAFSSDQGMLYFKSSANSLHAALMKNKGHVAGTVLPDKLNRIVIKGVQFEAIVLDTRHSGVKKMLGIYLAKHPLALAVPGEIWALQLTHIKMTDSSLGFGKKIEWHRLPYLKECVETELDNANLN